MYKRQTESDAYKFNLYPYDDSISLFMYDYEGEDGTACAVSFYTVSYTHLDVYKRQCLHRPAKELTF